MTYEQFKKDYVDSTLDSFEQVKDNVIFKLVNKKTSQELLSQAPYIEYMDLAIVFYYYVKDYPNNGGAVAINISNRMVEDWQVDVNALMEAAMENTPKLLGLKIRGIMSTIASYLDDENFNKIAEFEDSYTPLLVATNDNAQYGASVLIYKDMLKAVAGKTKSDLYVIPCSVHEIILVKVLEESSFSVDALKDMIKHVNETELRPEDVLSDNLYYYSRMDGSLGVL